MFDGEKLRNIKVNRKCELTVVIVAKRDRTRFIVILKLRESKLASYGDYKLYLIELHSFRENTFFVGAVNFYMNEINWFL